MRGAGLASAVAALAIALALQISNGLWDVRALVLMSIAAVLAGVAAFSSGSGGSPLATRAVLGGGAVIGLLFHVFDAPGAYADVRGLVGFRWLAATALVLLSAYLCIHLRASLVRARFLLLVICFVAMGAAVLRASPRPWIDVWVFQQGASDALLHGLDPYALSYPDIYGAMSFQVYSPEVAHGGRVFGFPYPPLSLLAVVPAFALLGDIRFAWLFAMAAGAWLVARGAGGVTGELAALLLLFQPRSFFVLEQAWTEPLLLVAFGLVLLGVRRRWAPIASGAALGALVAAKQYAIVFAVPLFFLLPRGARLRAAAACAATGCAVTLPFWIRNSEALLRGVVRFHFLQPLRTDGLSFLSAWARAGNVPQFAGALAVGLGALALIAWGAVSARRGVSPRPPEVLAAAAFTWIVVILFSKQGFCNYYWFCGALLSAAAAAKAERQGEASLGGAT